MAMTLHKLGELANNVRTQRKTNYRPLDPDVVVVEEAGQILEALMCNLIAVIRIHARFIQINDHMQLPVTWDSIENKANSNDRSQFARLLRLNGITEYSMLEVQHRTVPTIAAYPSKAFDRGALCNAVLASEQPRNFPGACQMPTKTKKSTA